MCSRRVLVSALVVEDFEPFRRFICSELGKKPDLQIVAEASDGLQAVQKAAELQPNLIVLNVGLPTLNGIEAARRISQLVPSAIVLFVSHSNDAAIVAAALSNGASGYVYKGDLRTELLPAVEAVLGGDRFLSRGLQTAELPQTKPQYIRNRL